MVYLGPLIDVTELQDSQRKYLDVSTGDIVVPSEFSEEKFKMYVSGGEKISINIDKNTKCAYCGQWGETHTVCNHCGAPIDGFDK